MQECLGVEHTARLPRRRHARAASLGGECGPELQVARTHARLRSQAAAVFPTAFRERLGVSTFLLNVVVIRPH
jgi:hypothetical protein